MMAVNGTHAVA